MQASRLLLGAEQLDPEKHHPGTNVPGYPTGWEYTTNTHTHCP